MVEIREGERIFWARGARRDPPRRHRAGRRRRGAAGSACGSTPPLHVHAGTRGVVRPRGRARVPARGPRTPRRRRDLGLRPARGRAHVRGDRQRAGAFPRPPRPSCGFGDMYGDSRPRDEEELEAVRALRPAAARSTRPATRPRRRPPHRWSRRRDDRERARTPLDPARRHRRAHGHRSSSAGRAREGRRRTSITTRRRFPRRRGRAHVRSAADRSVRRQGPSSSFPPDVVHRFENDGTERAHFFNFHMPASGFGDYMRGRKPDFDQHVRPQDSGSIRRRPSWCASPARFSGMPTTWEEPRRRASPP